MLQVSNVSLSLGGQQILDDVSVDVRAGELLALVGPNGAGKSTLLSVMSGDVTPDIGTAALDDVSIRSWKVRELARRRSVMLQEQGVAFGFRVVDVVRMGRAPWAGTDAEDEDDQVVAEMMARTEVLTFADRAYPTLSGGEKSRTSFARVMSQQAALVFLDEPTAALDLRHQEQVLSQARDLADEGHAVVTVLHDLSLAAAFADRVCLIAEGRKVADGPARDVFTTDLLSQVYGHPIELLEHRGSLIVLPQRGRTDAPTLSEEDPACTFVH